MVYVEGATRLVRNYKRLMLNRIQWTEAARARGEEEVEDDHEVGRGDLLLERLGDLLLPLVRVEQLGRLEEDVAPHGERRVLPGRERARGGRDGVLAVLRGRGRGVADDLARERVAHLVGAVVARGAELPVDEEAGEGDGETA